MYELTEEFKIYGLNFTFNYDRAHIATEESHPAYELTVHNPTDKVQIIYPAIFLETFKVLSLPKHRPAIEIQPNETKVILGEELRTRIPSISRDKFIIKVAKEKGVLFKILMSPLYLLYGIMQIYVVIVGGVRGGTDNAMTGLDVIASFFVGGKAKRIKFTRERRR